jgi:DNA-binding response OmpR family regulator
VKGEPEFAAAKARVRSLLDDFHAQGERGCEGRVHGFFGRLTGAEWGITQYKHLDHHLRQFGA